MIHDTDTEIRSVMLGDDSHYQTELAHGSLVSTQMAQVIESWVSTPESMARCSWAEDAGGGLGMVSGIANGEESESQATGGVTW